MLEYYHNSCHSAQESMLLIIEKNLKYAQSFTISAILKCCCCCLCIAPPSPTTSALNYNELTRTPLALFHQCFPVERRHLRHYNNCSLTIAVPLVMRIQDGSGRDRLKFSPNIRQEHEMKTCTLVFLQLERYMSVVSIFIAKHLRSF